MTHLLLCCAVALAAVDDQPYPTWTAEAVKVDALPETAGRRLVRHELAQLANGHPTLPFNDLTVGVCEENGTLWVGSHRGLMCLPPGAARWRLFHSRRWLPADSVQDLAIDGTGAVFVQTPAGIAKLARRQTTLGEKMAAIDDTLVKHHRRHGMVGGINLREPGRLDAGHSQHTNDNDGLWTSMYVAAEAFRFATTGDAQAKQNARQSLEALDVLGAGHRHSGFRCPQHRADRRRSARASRRVASLGRQSLVVERGHVERRGRWPLFCLRHLLRPGGRRRRKAARFASS